MLINLKLIILGDFNVERKKTRNLGGSRSLKHSKDEQQWIIYPWICSRLKLVTRYFFKKWSIRLFGLKLKHKDLIDFIITKRRDIGLDICNVRVLRNAESDADHKLVLRTWVKWMKFTLLIWMNWVKVSKRLYASKLTQLEDRTIRWKKLFSWYTERF